MAVKTRTRTNNRPNRRSYDSYRNFDAYNYNSGTRSNTSSAYQLNPRILDEDKYSVKKPKTRNKRRKKARNKTKFIFLENVYTKVSKETYLMLTVLFCGSLCMLMLGALVTNKRITVTGLQNKLKTAQEANLALSVEIAESYDEKEIERIATEVLGMSKPKPYQYFHINVPKDDRIIQYNTSEREVKTEQTIIQKIISILRKE